MCRPSYSCLLVCSCCMDTAWQQTWIGVPVHGDALKTCAGKHDPLHGCTLKQNFSLPCSVAPPCRRCHYGVCANTHTVSAQPSGLGRTCQNICACILEMPRMCKDKKVFSFPVGDLCTWAVKPVCVHRYWVPSLCKQMYLQGSLGTWALWDMGTHIGRAMTKSCQGEESENSWEKHK